jgi:hypothetical protein
MEHSAAAMTAADRLVDRLLGEPSLRDLWLLTPPLDSRHLLVPAFWWRRGASPGLLRSGSTHMAGLITGADLATTLGSLAGGSATGEGVKVVRVPAGGAGSASRTALSADLRDELDRLLALATRTERVRSVANRLIQWLLLLLLAAAGAALRGGRTLPAPLALTPLFLPPLLLLDGALRAGHPGLATGLCFLMLLSVISVLTTRWRDGDAPHGSPGLTHLAGLLAGATTLACAAALVTGDTLRWTALSYSINLGARFYGVGNEFMGWWVGAALLALSFSRPAVPRLVQVALLLLVAVLISHPSYGANLGGGITGLVAAGTVAWPLLRRRPLVAAGAVVTAAAAIVAGAAWDAARAPELQTHLGRLIHLVARNGPTPFLHLAAGKVVTNLRICLGLWGIMAALGLWVIREAGRRAPDTDSTRGMAPLLPVALTAFLTNDSGVISAALMLSYGAMLAGPRDRRAAGDQAVHRAAHSGQGQRARR